MKKLSHTGRILAVVIAAMVVFSATEVAFAVTNVPTSLSLNAPSKVKKRTVVTFSGKLSASKKKCRAKKTVALFRNGAKKATTKTKSNGSYSFRKKVSKKATWQTKFAGFDFGTHPNDFHCQASTSPSRTVKIKH